MSSVAGRPGRQADKALVAGWYRWFLPDHWSLGAVVSRWPARLRPLAWRFGIVQALTLLIAGRRHQVIATIKRDRGWRSLLVLSALCHASPKLAVLHFIDHQDRPDGVGRVIDTVWRVVERWALRRAMLRGQVLSAWESELYSRRYGIDESRFRFVPFAWRHPARGTPPDLRPASDRAGVLAAGRVSCDWPTLFAAAEGQAWPVTVVCPAADRPLVDQLNARGRARVLSDLPEKEVQRLLARAAVAVIAVRDGGRSQGHVRLCASVDAGAPIVASRTRSLEGYVEDGRTAVLVKPGDPAELREAINRLLSDPAARDAMAQAAWDRAAHWTWEDYLSALSDLVRLDGQAAASVEASESSDSSGADSDSTGASRREITLETPSAPIDTPYR